MKPYLLLTAFLLPLLPACKQDEQPNAWETFKQEHAGAGTTVHINGLMKLGLGILSLTDDDPALRQLLPIVRKMKDIEVHVTPATKARNSYADMEKLSRVLDQSNYENLLSVRKGKQTFKLWASGNEDTFRNPLAVINDGEDVVLLEMKGSLTTKDLQIITSAGMHYSR